MTAVGGVLAAVCRVCGSEVPHEHVVFEDEHCWFLRKPQAVLKGSGIIMPKLHRDTVFDLTPAEWVATGEMLLAAKALIDRELSPGGYNLGWNCGQAGGQQTLHAHLHVIPRFGDEPYAGRGIRWWFKHDDNLRSSLRRKVAPEARKRNQGAPEARKRNQGAPEARKRNQGAPEAHIRELFLREP